MVQQRRPIVSESSRLSKDQHKNSFNSSIQVNPRAGQAKASSTSVILRNKRELDKQSLLASGDLSSQDASVEMRELINEIIKEHNFQFNSVITKVHSVNFAFGLMTAELTVVYKEAKATHLPVKDGANIVGMFRSGSQTKNLLSMFKTHRLALFDPDFFASAESGKSYLLIKFFRLVRAEG